ncbi:hypothetical protein J3458_017972 [Metarhizium acridum]|uniref:uncharacterized protein n=1 Tax=Metarhizium acridum TaxID=92637 RepID=UPI001C6CC11D|nr:hypothetical protein J3458_017972 [Metarhizium acridum]
MVLHKAPCALRVFVPNVPSLSTLFHHAICKARVDSRDISLAKCHGTGTPVGNSVEWESIRNAVAGPLRDTVLPIGSAKGHNRPHRRRVRYRPGRHHQTSGLAREAEVMRLVAVYTTGWDSAELEDAANGTIGTRPRAGAVVLVTGASGSVGSHIVQALAERPHVATVVCINRTISDVPADKRQVA